MPDVAGMLEHIIRSSARALRGHACRWQGLPLMEPVESAAVTDEQTEQWSADMYQRDLEIEQRTGEAS